MTKEAKTLWQRKRIRTPTVLQMEATECGAACLAMVLGHYGRYVPLERLRIECGVSRDGSKASNILKAARRYGMEAKGYKKEPDQLGSLPLPMILHWNFNHYLLLDGIKGQRVYLNDPAVGPRTVSREELDECFTGVALTFAQGPEFEKAGSPPSVLPKLLQRLHGSRLAVLYAFLAGLGLAVLGLIIPIFSKVFVDEILIKGMSDWFRPLVVFMAATTMVQALLSYCQAHVLLRLDTKFALANSASFLWHVLRLPIEFYSQRYPGEIGSRVGLNDRVAAVLSGQLATSFLSLVLVVCYLGLMFQYDVVLTLIGVATAAGNVALMRWVGRMRTDGNLRLQQDRGKLTGVAMGGLQLIETLKATGSESDFFAKWSGHYAKIHNATQDLGRLTRSISAINPLLMSTCSTLVLGVGALRVMDGHLTIGMLVAFQTLMAGFLGPFSQMIGLVGTLQDVRSDLTRLDDVLEYGVDREIDSADEGGQDWGKGKLTGRVEIKNVSFRYSPTDRPLIQDFNLTVPPGGRVAFVGASGSGKSTLAKLVAGLYQTTSGEILFDGTPRIKLPRSVITSSVAFVDQDIYLFEGTVRENLTMWDTAIPEDKITRACKDACIHEDIAARDGGYEYMVGEDGGNFSGGQRQRLEIARALVGDPTILILDEATSALDPSTEQRITDALRRRACTCIVVAHRLSTIRDCDEIIVLRRGRTVERGPHDELLAADGPYAKLVKAH